MALVCLAKKIVKRYYSGKQGVLFQQMVSVYRHAKIILFFYYLKDVSVICHDPENHNDIGQGYEYLFSWKLCHFNIFILFYCISCLLDVFLFFKFIENMQICCSYGQKYADTL